MSSRIECAYCHETGHHIRFCSILAKKKEREYVQLDRIPSAKHPEYFSIPVVIEKETTNNPFSVLFSEEEEGEIVEDREEPVEMRKSWSRSGIKGVQIKYIKPDVNEQADDFNPALLESALKHISDYVAQFKGMDWADI